LYHRELKKLGLYSRGSLFREVAEISLKEQAVEFEGVLFCNLFYLSAAEKKIIKNVCAKTRSYLLFQGSEDDWSVLRKNAAYFGVQIKPPHQEADFKLSLRCGFDLHSQASLIRQILSEGNFNKKNTVIVAPRPQALIPLLSEVSCVLDEFNVSMGYPLRRTPVFSLFSNFLKLQRTRKNGKYYARDYLSVLSNPLLKNLRILEESVVMRIMVHSIEEIISGEINSSVGGSIFISLEDIEKEEEIYRRVVEHFRNYSFPITKEKCREALSQIHKFFFYSWKELGNLRLFSKRLNEMLDFLTENSPVLKYPLNLKAFEKMYKVVQELSSVLLSEEVFPDEDIWDIFEKKMESEIIAFSGSPLAGTQIIGLFETRALNFENVIVMDVNESVLPYIRIHEPLIPREVMLNLGVNRLEKEEEIQRYHFMRLLSGAKRVFLVYEENEIKEKSRFIEELIWKEEKNRKKTDDLDCPKASFCLQIKPHPVKVEKTPSMIKFLKNQVYSASRLNTYLNCPISFYFRYVVRLEEKEDLLKDPEARTIGTFIHELLEETFGVFLDRTPRINREFRRSFFRKMEEKFSLEVEPRMRSDAFLLKRIIKARLNKFLDAEAERKVKKIIGLEKECKNMVSVGRDDIEFVYKIDRIDLLKDRSIVIIDYKTGSSGIAPRKFSSLKNMDLTRDSIKENVKSFQLPLYYNFTARDFPGHSLSAELYNIRNLERTVFPQEEGFAGETLAICVESLRYIMNEIFDLNTPFSPSRDERKCGFCPFSNLCR
ncbi:MAG: hypothetical protein GF375_05420, partial [Candidatus Omnitrophica bacterium]|nr:hypothetical protein [Candidatus Omnitrophota bacterium]MBD3269425.1 hypothetical protein [Candidatus Omnitrophota bacterium]